MSQKAEHTPGPWKQNWVRPNKEKGHTFDPRCSILAHSKEYNADIRIADIPDPLTAEEEANARLIAAAPRMLAALKKAGAAWGPDGSAEACIEAEQEVLAAIAEAELAV